ncbi:MAG: hypothetical protein RIS09_292 [Actinomycetota bacterium]
MYSSHPSGNIQPTFQDFAALANTRRVIPVVAKVLADGYTAIALYQALAENRPGTFLLESAESGKTWSRYSFIGVNSKSALIVKDGECSIQGEIPVGLSLEGNGFDVLENLLALLQTEATSELPPFTGGLVGMISYDAVRWLENIGKKNLNELDTPEIALLLSSDLAVIDHWEGTLWVIANAINYDSTSERLQWAYEDACSRVNSMLEKARHLNSVRLSSTENDVNFTIQSNTSKETYVANVLKAKEYIQAGDAFQIVLSQRFECDVACDSFDVYRMLRAQNPSPYMYYLRFGHEINDTQSVWFDVVGSSPEALVKLRNQEIEMHPIAGTRKRGATHLEDDFNEANLLSDVKERAEHLMLVDLGRNDLGRVSKPGSVDVPQFMQIEKYSHVMHLVSRVNSHIASGKNAIDVLKATFPAGTLSGAPKPRAMQIIEELETTRRGLYGGVVGYFDFAGNMDVAIAIRTALIQNGKGFVQAGAGIVADSDPESEFEECVNKASAALRAIAHANALKDI